MDMDVERDEIETIADIPMKYMQNASPYPQKRKLEESFYTDADMEEDVFAKKRKMQPTPAFALPQRNPFSFSKNNAAGYINPAAPPMLLSVTNKRDLSAMEEDEDEENAPAKRVRFSRNGGRTRRRRRRQSKRRGQACNCRCPCCSRRRRQRRRCSARLRR